MSVLNKSSLRDYRSLRPIIHTPYVASVGMSRDRFLALLTMFHLNNNDAKAARGQPGYDPLFKIWPVTDTLITKFQDVYTPQKQLTINKAICPFRGRIVFRVYIKGKPHKYGIKMLNFVRQKAATSTIWTYILVHILPTQNTTRRSVLLTGCVIK